MTASSDASLQRLLLIIILLLFRLQAWSLTLSESLAGYLALLCTLRPKRRPRDRTRSPQKAWRTMGNELIFLLHSYVSISLNKATMYFVSSYIMQPHIKQISSALRTVNLLSTFCIGVHRRLRTDGLSSTSFFLLLRRYRLVDYGPLSRQA